MLGKSMNSAGIVILAFAAIAASGQESSRMRIVKECDLEGRAYRSLPASVAACTELCQKDEACRAFTVSAKPGDGAELTCDLKREVGIQVLKQRGFTSGIKLRSAQAAGDGPNDLHRVPPDRERFRIAVRDGVPPEVPEELKAHLGRLQSAEPIELAAAGAGVETPAPAVRPLSGGAQVVGPAAAPKWAGRWSMAGGAIVRISQSGDDITFHDSAGLTAPAKLSNGRLIVDAWKVEAQMVESGRKLQWSNGQTWTRVD